MKDVFVDDFLNVFEIACSIQGKKEGAQGEKDVALGVVFLNKHCFVHDLKPSKLEHGPTLLRRSVEVRLQILEEILGWKLLVIDEAEYMELFKQGKSKKKEREEYVLSRLQFDEEG